MQLNSRAVANLRKVLEFIFLISQNFYLALFEASGEQNIIVKAEQDDEKM